VSRCLFTTGGVRKVTSSDFEITPDFISENTIWVKKTLDTQKMLTPL